MKNEYEIETRIYFAKLHMQRDEELQRFLSSPRTREEWFALLEKDEDESA